MRWPRFLLASALIAFGAVAGASAPGSAIEPAACGEQGDIICQYDEETTCVARALCPYGLQGYYLCCVQLRIDRDYHYWDDAAH